MGMCVGAATEGREFRCENAEKAKKSCEMRKEKKKADQSSHVSIYHSMHGQPLQMTSDLTFPWSDFRQRENRWTEEPNARDVWQRDYIT